MDPQDARSGSGFVSAKWVLQAVNRAASSGKWRYTVERRTPARSATALIDVRDGPTVPCSSIALSVMRRRVSASSSARRFFSYLRVSTVIGVR